jgi:hypothetical protein
MGEVSGGAENDETARVRRYCCRCRVFHHHRGRAFGSTRPPKPLRMEGGGVLIVVSGSPIGWTRSVGLACRTSMSNSRHACAELKSHRLLAAWCRICRFAALRRGWRDRIVKLSAARAVEKSKAGRGHSIAGPKL